MTAVASARSGSAALRDLVALLRLVRDERDDEAFARVAPRLGRGLGPAALRRLAREGHLLPAARRGVLPARYYRAVARVVTVVDGLRTQRGTLRDRVWSAWRTLGLADDPRTAQGRELAALLARAERARSLDALVAELE